MIQIEENKSLKELNSFGIDAKASAFLFLEEFADLVSLPEIVSSFGAVQIMGEGSNILFTGDYDGLVILNRLGGIEFENVEGDNVIVQAGGGVNWDDLVNVCCDKGYNGLENLSLIPGTVGAAPVQNIGAYGVELKDIMISCDTLNIRTGESRQFLNIECEFGYRNSIFKRKYKNELLITSVKFKLTKEKSFILSYRELQEKFQHTDKEELTASEIRDFVKSVRESKLPNPEEIGNAGSFFKNPELTKSKLGRIQRKHGKLTFFKIGDKYKIPAAWLIEQSGLKGVREGNTGTYINQPLVIVNYGVESGKEIQAFSKKIQNKVYEKFGIMLEPEVNII